MQELRSLASNGTLTTDGDTTDKWTDEDEPRRRVVRYRGRLQQLTVAGSDRRWFHLDAKTSKNTHTRHSRLNTGRQRSIYMLRWNCLKTADVFAELKVHLSSKMLGDRFRPQYKALKSLLRITKFSTNYNIFIFHSFDVIISRKPAPLDWVSS